MGLYQHETEKQLHIMINDSTTDYVKNQWDDHIRKSKLFLQPKTLV
jgi:hypothetical protein